MSYDAFLELCGYEKDEIEDQRKRTEWAIEKLRLRPDDFQRAEQRMKEYFDVDLISIRKMLGLWFRSLTDIVLAREEGTQVIRYTVSEGQRMDLHAGAGGKVLLAFASEEILESFLSKSNMDKRTLQTITNKRKLKAELKQIRKQGFATSQGERVSDAYAIAAPVFDGDGGLVGALGIAGPISRFTVEIRKSLQNMIVDHADKVSSRLGWKPS